MTVDNPFLLFIDEENRSTQITSDETSGATHDSTSVTFEVTATIINTLSKNRYWLQFYADIDSVTQLVYEGYVDMTDEDSVIEQSVDFTLPFDGEEYLLLKDAAEADLTLEKITDPDANPFTVLGGIEQDTSLQRVPRVTINKYGIISLDQSGHNLPNLFFKVLSGVAPGQTLNLLNLYARNTDGGPALLGQNGVGWLHVVNIENAIGGPFNPETNLAWFSGEADVVVTTVNRFCEVKLIASDGRIAVNHTYNIGPSITWSGWKLQTYATKSFDAGKIIQSISEQEVANGEAGFHEDGTLWIGNPVKFQGAKVSTGGRMAGEAPLFVDDFTTLGFVNGALALYATAAYVSQIATDLYNQIANKANLGHTHPIAEINGLQTVLDTIIGKAILATGSPHWGLGVDENGLAKMIDNNRTLLNAATRLPSAQEGEFYDFYLPPSLFIFPIGHDYKEVISSCTKDWIGLSWDNTTGLRLYGTPTDDEDVSVVIKMRWRFSYLSRMQEDEKTLLLPVLPTAASVTAPSAPTGLNAVANPTTPQTSVNLTWTDTSSNETNFVVERSLDNITWEIIATLGPNVTSFTDTGRTANTLYYYRVKAINGPSLSSAYATDSVTTDATVVIPNTDDWVANTSYVKSWAPIVVPPVDPGPNPNPNPNPSNPGVFFGNGKPLYKIVGLQPAAAVEADNIVWVRRDNPNITRIFDNFDQNNNPNREVPDANTWKIQSIDGPDTWIQNASDAGLNACIIWIRWETYQVSDTRYMTEIIDYILDYANQRGVFIEFRFSLGCGNGGLTEADLGPGAFIGGHDQTATWRYLKSDIMRMQKFDTFAGDSPTSLKYPIDGYPPCLLRERVYLNVEKLFRSIANHLRNHPNKAIVLGVAPIIANTGESHMPINGGGICDASDTAMLLFKKFLLSQNSTVQGWFSAFLSDPLNTTNTNARNFLRGYTSGETYRIWQYWIQNYYFWGRSYRGGVVRSIVPPGEEFLGNAYYFGLFQTIALLIQDAGIDFNVDHGSAIDGNGERVNNFAIDPAFTNFVNGFKWNPAGSRTGYVEAAAVRATGKKAYLEWTPGALDDFGSVQAAIDVCTQQTKDTMDSDVIPFFSFVATGSNYINILKPIIQRLKDAGYWNLPNDPPYDGTDKVDVNLSVLNGTWYNSATGPLVTKFNSYPNSTQEQRRAAIRKIGFNIAESTNPAPGFLTVY